MRMFKIFTNEHGEHSAVSYGEDGKVYQITAAMRHKSKSFD